MILTIVGTHEQQFDRLITAVNALPADLPRVTQYGYSTIKPTHGMAYDFIPFDEVERLMDTAQVVITHAGTGTVMLALSRGKTPVVAPRFARFGEHVDDHQLELVESLAALDLIVPYYAGDDLAAKIAQAASRTGTRRIEPNPQLVSYLEGLLAVS